MSTVVCQGLQSCLEPQVKETATLRLKLAAPKSIGLGNRAPSLLHKSNTKEIREKCQNDNTTNQMAKSLDLGGWSFLQNLSNSSQIPKSSMDVESSYVHPKANSCPSLRLSEKSLELCTENLGSETGSDTSESSIFSLSSLESGSEESPKWEQKISRQFPSQKKANSRSFPPPLTTISGSNSIQVRPHREDGRLIIKAVETPSMRTCFEAERSHGRLKLRFLQNCKYNYEHKVASEESNEKKDDKIDPFETDPPNDEEDAEEFEGEEENGAYIMEKDMGGNSVDVEVEMGMEKFQRPSRCKEGGNGSSDKGRLCNWEGFWVATS